MAQVNVYTRSNDNSRTGANLQETILTPAKVNSSNFGKLFTIHTDGQIYAQPLYVSNLAIAGGTHNVVFVASMLNTIYALDADTGAALWTKNYGSPIIPQDVESDQNIVWSTRLGILGTPVIDPATNVMYFVSGSQPANGARQFAFNLNAVDITTGLPVHGSPVNISATYSTPDLTNPLVFNAKMQNPRPGLALANGNVYLAFASHEDQQPYHGFVLAYSTSTLAQTAVYADTTIGGQGGIWNAGQAPAVDAAGNLYFSTGNGSFGKTPNNLVQTGNSFIKLSPTLELLDYFTPYNSASLNSGDMDLGSSGLLLVPKTSYLLGGGKQGVLYLTDTRGMGEFNSSSDQVRQEFQAVYGKGTSHIHGGVAYFESQVNGPAVYVWGENDLLRGFLFNSTTGLINTTPFATSSMTAPVTNNDGAMPGGFLSISANDDTDGIVWASTPYNGNAVHQSVQGVLYAFNADTLDLLWSDKTNDARDEVGMFAKYVPPLVANGKLYAASFGALGTNDGSGALVVYGLLKPDLTVNVANAGMTAGAALPTFSGTVTGLKNGDTVGTTITVTYSTTATSSSPAGTYPINATVSGSSANNYQVVVKSGTLTISPASQTLTVTANNATRTYGAANPAFTGTITGAQNGDTFTESFSTAAATTSNVGSYAIVPAASGSNLSNYNVVIVDGTLTVTGAATTTTLTAPASSTYNSSVSLTATVASTAGTPAGTVTFLSGSTTLGAATLNGSGVATLNTTGLAVGTDAVTAAFAASGNFAGSTSTASNVTVNQASQTITFPAVASRPYGSAAFAVSATSSAGSSYPVTITVQSGPAAISGGVVSLTSAGTVVLQAAQAGDTNVSAATTTQSFQVTPAPLTVAANNAGRAFGAANPAFSGTITGAVGSDSFSESFTTTAAAGSNVGSYPIVPAVTGPQSNYTITLVNGILTVTAASTATTLNAPASAASGANVTLTATVTSSAGTPGGIVTFHSGAAALGTGTLNGNGVATLSTTALPVGTDSVTADYAAAGNFAASTSPAGSITVNAASQTINFPAIAPHAYGSAAFAVSATSSLGSSYPVTISVLSGPAFINGGVVNLTGAGTVVLQASQAGDANNPPATTTQSVQVLPAQLTVAANNATRPYGAANPAFTGTISGAVGSDSFSESFSTVATPSSNAGTFTIAPVVAGPQLANYTVTAMNGTLTVSAAATTTALTAPASAAYGASVVLTATVSSTAGTPAGTVTFLSGSTALGTAPLNPSGTAALTTTTLPAGTDTVTASYAGQGNYAASGSTATVTVNAASQTINFPAIASRPYGSATFAVSASSSLGSNYPVTITVASGPATISGGMVSVTGVGIVVLQATQAGDSKIAPATANQSFQVTPAPLTVTANNATRIYAAANPVFSGTMTGAVGSDTFSESFTSSALAASNIGTYPIVPSVTGAPLGNYTVTAVTGTLTVTAAATTTTVSAPASAASGAQVTLTAVVSSTAGTPAGTVTFYAGSTVLGTGTLNGSGMATVSTTGLETGTDTITAFYAAAGNFAASTSPAVIVTVGATPVAAAGSYTVTASPTSLTVKQGAATDTMLTFAPSGGYRGSVTLSCANLPSYASCVFAQNQVSFAGNNQSVKVGLTIQTTTQSAGKQSPTSTLPSALLALAFWWPGSLSGLAVFARKRRLVKKGVCGQICLLVACTLTFAAGLSGCGMKGYEAHVTPALINTQVTVVATGTSATDLTQTLALTLNITR